MTTQLQWIQDFEISMELDDKIRRLLQTSFADWDYPAERRYYKQRPPRRLLAWDSGRLIGQVGVEYRSVRLSDGPAGIFGIIDLCIDPGFRRRGIARSLLLAVEELGRRHSLEFLVLFALDERLYLDLGYEHQSNCLRWLKIHDHRSLGIGEERVDELMVKPLTSRLWADGDVDLLGYLF